MLSGPRGTEQDLVGQCSVCGRIEALSELPGSRPPLNRTEVLLSLLTMVCASSIGYETREDALVSVVRSSHEDRRKRRES